MARRATDPPPPTSGGAPLPPPARHAGATGSGAGSLAHLALPAADDDLDAFYWDLFHAIRQEVGCDAFGIDLLDAGTGIFLGTFYVDTVQGHHRRVEPPTLGPLEGEFLRSIAEGAPRLLLRGQPGGAEAGDTIARWGNSQPRPSMMFVALRRGNAAPVGILTVQSYDEGAYRPADLARLERLAAARAEAIALRQEAERASHEIQELRACERLLETIVERRDLGEVLYETLCEAVRFLRAHTGAIYLLHGKELRLESSHGLTTRYVSQVRSLAAADHPHLFSPFVRREPLAASLGRLGEAEKRLGVQCLAGTPLRQGHRVLGALVLGSISYSGFTSESLRFLKRIATHVSTIIAAQLEMRAAEQQEARIRAYFDSRPEAIVITSPEGRVRDWNTAAAALLARDAAGPSGRPIAELLDLGGADALARLLVAARREPVVLGECRVIDAASGGPAGSPVRLKVLPIYGGASVEPESFAFQLHATGPGSGEREAAPAEPAGATLPAGTPPALAEAAPSASPLLAALADVTFVARPGDPLVFQSISGDVAPWIGRASAEVLVDPYLWSEAIIEEDRSVSGERMALVARGRPYSLQYRVRDAAGELRLVQEVGVPLLDAEGCLEGIVGAWSVLGPERRIEQRLAEARAVTIQRLLAGGIAQRIENVTTAILSAVTQGRRLIGDSGPGSAALRVVEQASREAADLAHSLFDVAGLATPAPEPIDLNDLLGGILPALHAGRLRWHRLDYLLAGDLPRVHADRAMLRRAVLELLDNALEARPERGRLTLTTSRGPRWAGGDPAGSGPDGVLLAIEDDGPGPRHLLQQRVPAVFASTKGPGRGLGLVVASEIARALGGELTLGVGAGRGAVARLWLPLPPDTTAAGRSTGATSAAAATVGGPMALLLEPDPIVRDLVAGQLESLGLQCVGTQSAAEVLGLLHAAPGRWDVVLFSADDPLGDMAPSRLVVRLRDLQPDLKLVALTSPAAIPTAPAEGESDPDAGQEPPPSLVKPFRLDDLSALLRRLGVAVRRRDRSGEARPAK